MNRSLALGVDIGGSYLASAAVNLERGSILEPSYARIPIDPHSTSSEIISNWCKVIRKSLKLQGEAILRIGLAMPGPFDYKNGISLIRENHKYEGLFGLNMKEILAEKLNIRTHDIFMMNDAAAFLQGEIYNGASPEYKFQKVIGLSIGTGLGTAMFDTDKCHDLNLWCTPFLDGIAEDYFSTRWFVKRYLELTGDRIKGVIQISAFNKSTPASKQLYKEFSTHLDIFLHRLTATHNPNAIILGGNIASAFQTFFPELRRSMNKRGNFTPVYKAKLREKAGILGAASNFKYQEEMV